LERSERNLAMQTDLPSYFLFPHLTLAEDDLRTLSVFLPNCNIMEIVHPAIIPEWLRDRFQGRPAIPEKDFSVRIESCIKGYGTLAHVHGGGAGILALLGQARGDTLETRLRIQEELRGKCPSDLDEQHRKIFQAAVFLEIARELDEKEIELQGSYVQLNALEREFRGILGIAGEDEADEAETNLSPPLIPDRAGALFMLPTRIESWLQLFSLQPAQGLPVYVANHPDVIAETVEIIRSAHGSSGEFTPVRISLGSFPGLDQLGSKQFRSLTEAPGIPALLDSYRRDLDKFILEAAGTKNPDELVSKSKPLKHRLDEFCSRCALSGSNRVNLSLYFMANVLPAGIPGFSGEADKRVDCLLHAGSPPPLFLCID